MLQKGLFSTIVHINVHTYASKLKIRTYILFCVCPHTSGQRHHSFCEVTSFSSRLNQATFFCRCLCKRKVRVRIHSEQGQQTHYSTEPKVSLFILYQTNNEAIVQFRSFAGFAWRQQFGPRLSASGTCLGAPYIAVGPFCCKQQCRYSSQ